MTHPDRIGALLILLFCCSYGFLIPAIPLTQASGEFSARSMPTFICSLAIIYSLWLLIAPGPQSETRAKFAGLNWALGIAFCVLMSGYGFSLRPLGFMVATTLFLLIGFYLLGERRYPLLMITASGVAVLFWLIMTQILGAYLPALPEIF